MQFALIDNQRKEAEHGQKGICPFCSQPVIAKCGKIKINHWAHKSNEKCDNWSEPETEWHRTWKNIYPTDWQEKIMHDKKTNEKHIADVCTHDNLVLEFQHSYIKHEERILREQFYRNMVWIVDGTRLTRDFPRFIADEKARINYKDNKDIFLIFRPEKYFPPSWLKTIVPVIFDFKGTEQLEDEEDARNYIYCLFPLRIFGGGAIFARISRSSFVNTTRNGKWSMRIKNFMDSDSEFVHNTQENQNQITLKHKQGNAINEIECNQYPVISIKQPHVVFPPRRYGTRRGSLIDDLEKKQFPRQFKPRKKGRKKR
jgi:hypothetical protein